MGIGASTSPRRGHKNEGNFASGAFSKTPAKRPSKDSQGSYAETQYSALGSPSVFLGFVIGHRCQVIGNSEVTWIHVV